MEQMTLRQFKGIVGDESFKSIVMSYVEGDEDHLIEQLIDKEEYDENPAAKDNRYARLGIFDETLPHRALYDYASQIKQYIDKYVFDLIPLPE